MYKNFLSLSLFVKGVLHHKKIRHLNAQAHEYNVDLLAGCKTRTDWRFVENKEYCFCNLFRGGKPTRGSCAFNTNDAKIKRDQWGGTCVTALGWFSTFVFEVGTDNTGLGRWSWVHVGGGGKTTRIITAYHSHAGRRDG